jgi:hypothetical protein
MMLPMGQLSESPETWLDKLGLFLARRLEMESSGYEPYTPSDPEILARTLRPGDVLLVESNQKISAAIKYLTQSTWSHAAFYVGDAAIPQEFLPSEGRGGPFLIEVNLGDGCIAVPLSKYASYNTRICRPVALTPDDRNAIVDFAISRLGLRYDLKNIFDMLRYFFPTPPVPVRWRRRMIAFGSGSPTRAICSTMIAEAFETIRYPILPGITRVKGQARAGSSFSRGEILHIRDHSLFTPRDFDLSPYFQVVKPTLEYGFDYKNLTWENGAGSEPKSPDAV